MWRLLTLGLFLASISVLIIIFNFCGRRQLVVAELAVCTFLPIVASRLPVCHAGARRLLTWPFHPSTTTTGAVKMLNSPRHHHPCHVDDTSARWLTGGSHVARRNDGYEGWDDEMAGVRWYSGTACGWVSKVFSDKVGASLCCQGGTGPPRVVGPITSKQRSAFACADSSEGFRILSLRPIHP